MSRRSWGKLKREWGNKGEWARQDLRAAFNPKTTAGRLVLSSSRLTVSATSGAPMGNVMTFTDLYVSTGKWYCELTFNASVNDSMLFGVCEAGHSVEAESWPGDTGGSYGLYSNDGETYNDGNNTAYGVAVGEDETMMMALNMPDGEIFWGSEGTWFNSGDPAAGTNPAYTGLSGDLYIAVSLLEYLDIVTLNVGGSPFQHTIPTGFKRWNLA